METFKSRLSSADNLPGIQGYMKGKYCNLRVCERGGGVKHQIVKNQQRFYSSRFSGFNKFVS